MGPLRSCTRCREFLAAALVVLCLAAAPASASYTTSAPRGNWVGTYGSRGFDLAAWNGGSDLISMPGVSARLVQGYRWVWWSNNSDPRLLESPGQSGRVAATYWHWTEIQVRLSFSSAYEGNLELYALDPDDLGRRETVTVGDQTANLNSDFSQGAWITFPISVAAGASLTIKVDRTAGVNAVLSGIFLDAGGSATATSGGPCASNLTPSSGISFCRMGQAAPSPMNQPLPTNPAIDPNSDAIVANLNTGQHNADFSEFGTTVEDASTANATATIHCTEPWGTCSLEGVTVPVSPSWRPSWGSDQAMVIVDRRARKVYDLWQVATTNTGTINVSNGGLSTSWGGVTSPDGNGQNRGATGSNMSHLFGMVRMFEIANAPSSPAIAINHALHFSSAFTCPSYRYPATKSDGHSSGACIPEGARVFLDSSANCAAVAPVGSEAVCYALQKYGAYDTDTSGSPFSMGFEGDGVDDVPSVYGDAGFTWDYYDLRQIPWSHLHVAADCQCT